MAETRPIGEQLRFISQFTGNHVLDDYLEAAEKGNRTLSDMLGDIRLTVRLEAMFSNLGKTLATLDSSKFVLVST